MTPPRLQRAIRELLKLEPFWAMILLRWEIVEDPSQPYPFGTNGRQLRHRPDLWEPFADPVLVWILAHEVLHVIGAHHARRKGRPVKEWNEAADYAINDTLITRWGDRTYPIRTPEGILYDPRFSGWSAEAIYAELFSNRPQSGGQQQPQQQPGPPAPGQGPGAAPPQQSPPTPPSPSPQSPSPQSGPQAPGAQVSPGAGNQPSSSPAERFGYVLDADDDKQAEGELNSKLAEAATFCARAGMGIDSATRRQLDRAKISTDWEQHLAAYLYQAATRAGCDDFSWSRPQTVTLQTQGLYVPSTVQNDPPPFTAAIDTSGSVNARQLAEMAAGLRGILDQWDNARADVLYCDSEIRGRTVCYAGSVDLKPKGGGGTLFEPVFDADPGRELLVYFTDLRPYRNRFPARPAYPVLWIYTGREEIPPPVPYGKVVRLRAA